MQPQLESMQASPAAVEATRELEELVNLTLPVISINGWNRVAISFRRVPRSPQESAFS